MDVRFLRPDSRVAVDVRPYHRPARSRAYADRLPLVDARDIRPADDRASGDPLPTGDPAGISVRSEYASARFADHRDVSRQVAGDAYQREQPSQRSQREEGA